MCKVRGRFMAYGALLALTAGVGFGRAAWAAPPAEAEVQGLYEGTGRDAAGEFKLEARVVAQGNGTYKVLLRRLLAADRVERAEMAGKTAGDAVTFASVGAPAWSGAYAAGVIRGEFGQGGTFQAQRVEKKSPTLGKKPPEGAVVLLDGRNWDEMARSGGAQWYLGDMTRDGWVVWEAPVTIISQKQPADWPTPEKPLPEGWTLSQERRRADVVLGIGEDGSIRVPKGGMSSKRSFEGSFDLHVEFMCPLVPTAHSQGRGNSGVHLPNGEEIQVLDSFGDATYVGGGCGGLYHYQDPAVMEPIESLKDRPENQFTLASLPPLTWQTYDIEYRVEKKDGKAIGKPKVTVTHNGIKIHDNFALRNDARPGRFNFQDHGNPVRYRNIWVLPVEK